MIYLLQPEFESELSARQEYLSVAFNSYFILIERNSEFIGLQSFPLTPDNIIIFYGHNSWIAKLFLKLRDYIKEDIKIINSCDIGFLFEQYLFKDYTDIYFSKTDEYGFVPCYKGSLFNLSFDATQSEIEMLNKSHLPLIERIHFAYRKVA